jgi:hypothetical protein
LSFPTPAAGVAAALPQRQECTVVHRFFVRRNIDKYLI